MDEKIAIIGAGQLGRALGKVFARGQYEINLWDREPGEDVVDLPEALSGAQLVFFAVPSISLREAIIYCKPYMETEAVSIILTKGLCDGRLPVELAASLLPRRPLAVVGGPMLAEELAEDLGGGAVIAGNAPKVTKKLAELFSSVDLAVEESLDISGISAAGILKNIYAIGAGSLDALSAGNDLQGMYLSRAWNEMAKIIPFLGGEKESALGWAGLGDLIATASSRQSDNFEFGRCLSLGNKPARDGEGFRSLAGIIRRVGPARMKNLPILAVLGKICDGDKPVGEILLKSFYH